MKIKGKVTTSQIDYLHSAMQGADQEYLINTPRNRESRLGGILPGHGREGESPDEPPFQYLSNQVAGVLAALKEF